ncbi:MAG: dethiobiotin synthase [Pseudomonadales bacterium]
MRAAQSAYFVTGTDTDAGKTLVTEGLLAAARQQGLATLAIKPVAAGCECTPDGLRNDDAVKLMAQMTESLSYDEVNPVALEPAIAPHIAAQQAGHQLTLDTLITHCQTVLEQPAQLALIEGAGGWRLPLNETEYLSGLPQALGLPVILVIGMKLGCINHALLTVEAIANDGVPLAGWVANGLDANMSCFDENLQTLKSRIKAPLLGVIPFLVEAEDKAQLAASHLDIRTLLSRD